MRLKRSSDEFCGSVIFHVGVGAFENVYIRFVIFFYPDEGCTLLELEEKSRDVDPLKPTFRASLRAFPGNFPAANLSRVMAGGQPVRRSGARFHSPRSAKVF